MTAKEQRTLRCPTVRPRSLIRPSTQRFLRNGSPSASVLSSSTSPLRLQDRTGRETLTDRSRQTHKRWWDTGTDKYGASHPRLSTVREEIRFSLQPVSIRTFTSRPKHWEEEEVVLQGGKTACFPNYLEMSKHNNLAGNVDQIPLFLFFFFFIWVEMSHGQKNSSSSFSGWQAHPSSGQLGLQQPLLEDVVWLLRFARSMSRKYIRQMRTNTSY